MLSLDNAMKRGRKMKEEFTEIKEEITKDIENKETEPSLGKRFLTELFSWIKIIVIAMIVAFLVNNFIIINANVPTGSMKNLIQPGDRMIGFRFSYWFSEPERGDVVIFKFPDNPDETYVKRLIGMPGDKVTIKDSKVYINDSTEPLVEEYLPEEWQIKNGTSEQGGILVYEVPEGEYFMLGDNRNVSSDARYWNDKFVSEDQIIAKAACTYWPFNHMKTIKGVEY